MQRRSNTAVDIASGCPIRIRHLDDVIGSDTSEVERKVNERPLRYGHLQPSDKNMVDRLLRGGIDLSRLPQQRPNVARVFVCSSGPDFDAERNYLLENVYPLVRKFCRGNYGVDFQMVDMYWGDHTMPTKDPYKFETVLKELEHCQTISDGPNFVAFVGQKYGNSTLQAAIPSSQMTRIMKALADNSEARTLLENFYTEDINIKPNVYRLKQEMIAKDPEGMASLQSALVSVVPGCLLEHEAEEFLCSDFERLLNCGVLDCSTEDEARNCLVYMRNIKNIEQHLSAKNAANFVDIDQDKNTWDTQKKNKLLSLKADIEKVVPEENILKTEITLNGCTLDEQASGEYVSNIGKHFYSSMIRMVEEQMSKRNSVFNDPLINEVFQHWHQTTLCSAPFIDREEVLNTIKGYILSETDQPLVLAGKPGSGKTSIIAKAANDINEAIASGNLSMPTVVIPRFVGETENTTDVQSFLFHLCHQLAYLTGRYRQDVPIEYSALKNYFIDTLQRGEYGGMLVLLIDSLESISTVHNGHKLEWLPSRIASNIKVVITVDSDKSDMIGRFENKVDSGVIYLPAFTAIDCENAMKQLMVQSERSVNYEQWKCIQSAFKACSSPVYAKLVFQEVLQWHSYDNASENLLPHSVDKLVLYVLQKLESKYGRLVVSRVLGYMTASVTGFTESELEDIMSLDDILLNEVYVRNNSYPGLRRLPPHIWCQIRQELRPYLVRKEVNGVAVYSLKDISVVRVAKQRYCQADNDTVVDLYSTVSDYFLGTWAGIKRKPFHHPCVLMAKYKLVNCNDESCRYVQSQELSAGDNPNQFINRRKLSQLPYALKMANRIDDLKSSVFCNYEWLETKLKVSSVQGLIADFSMSNNREMALVAEALRMSKSAVAVNPKSLGMELSGRLLPYVSRYKSIKELIRQCDLQAQRSCPLVPNCQIYSAPGGPLQYECEVGGDKTSPIDIDVFSSPDGILLTAKPYYSNRLQVWELQNGDERPDIMLPVGQVKPTRDGRYINIVLDNKTVKSFRSDSGVQHGEVNFGPGKLADIDVSNRYIALVTEKGAGPYVIDIERNELLHRFTYHTHAVAISDDETYLVFNSETSLLLHELPVMKRKCVATATGIPEDIIFINGMPKCYILTKTKLIESITFDVINRKFKCKTILTDLEAKQCIPSGSKKLMIVRCGKTLHILDTVLDKVKSRIQKLPPGVFVDNKSTFSGAGFTPDESKIVACRYTYLIVWDAVTCAPVRVLQSFVSPMMKLFTSETINKVVTLLKDNTFQVWNLDNLDRDIQHSIEIHQGAVQSMAVSTDADVIISHDDKAPDAKLVCLGSGKVVDTLQHSENPLDRVVKVTLSPDGKYAVTRAQLVFPQNFDNKSATSDFTDDIMWEVETASKVFHATSNRYIEFSPSSDLAVFVTCAFHNPLDWSENMYNIFIVNPETSSNYTIDFPYCSEFVNPPSLISKNGGTFFVAVIQTSKSSFNQNSSKEVARWSEIRLFIQRVTPAQNSEDQELLRLQNMTTDVGDLDQFLAVLPVFNGNILAVYAKNIESYPFEFDKGVVPPRSLQKGAVLYDVSQMTPLRHFTNFMHSATDVTSVKMSSQFTVIMDSDLRLYSIDSFKSLGTLKCVKFFKNSVSLTLDGRYAVGISENQRDIIIVRTVDDTRIGSVFVHGKATFLSVACDDRTVVVGCEDGRVMIFSLILELSDPLRELIEKFPSRCESEADTKLLIQSDMKHISNSTTDQHRLSARLRKASMLEERRPPSYTTLQRAVTVSRQSSRHRGESPCIQQ